MAAKRIPRDSYLQQLQKCQENGMIKIISGVRRSGKSYLLFEIFQEYLRQQGIDEAHIITHRFDDPEVRPFKDVYEFFAYLKPKIQDDKTHYILLDEIQFLPDFEKALNGFIYHKNLDVYVTGSNARFLVKDVLTEFRGRSTEIRVFPLSLGEFYAAQKQGWDEAVKEYLIFGGMPQVLTLPDQQMKTDYLRKLVQETYLRDIVERQKIRHEVELAEIFQVIASNIGAMTNPLRLANTIHSAKKLFLSSSTIGKYLDYFEDAFLIKKAIRYNIKGRRYINTPAKYYFVDPGLRNACLEFRQIEETHLLENIIYMDLLRRGYQIDVGLMPVLERTPKNTYVRRDTEVDFVAHKINRRYYMQVAWDISSKEKEDQEKRSLRAIEDGYKRILILRGGVLLPYQDEDGILVIGLEDFILHPEKWE